MRKLILLAVSAVAALAFMAPAASAQVEVESLAEGVMCDDTTAGHCSTSYSASGADLVVHTFFGEVAYDCDIIFVFHVYSDGSIVLEAIIIGPGPGSNCDDLVPCEEPWTAQLTESGGAEHLAIDLCIDNGLVMCEGTLNSGSLQKLSNPLRYRGNLNDVEIVGDPSCEFTGVYTAGGIQIHH